MRRALGLALVLTALAAAPAGAAVPPPTIIGFENASGQDPQIDGARFSAECGTVVQSGSAFSGSSFLHVNCDPAQIAFDAAAQATVSVYYRVPATGGGPGSITAVGLDETFQNVVASTTVTPPARDQWFPLVVRTTDGNAAIHSIRIDYDVAGAAFALDLDEVGFSPTPQPDVDITDGPSGTVTSGDATFTFAGNQDQMSFFCKLGDQPSEPCNSPKSYSGLATGQHTFQVIGKDRWGTNDPSPPGRTWTVEPVADRDADGVLDATDNCPDAANAGQGDSDKDGVGDACEVLPSGNTPIEAGRFATAKLISGEVLVKLPPGATGSAFTAGLRVPFQSSGFVSLKGVAAVPMGSTLDTRKGEVALTAAVNGQPARSRKQVRREARFRAGIFAIRQARKKRRAKRSKRIPPRAELASPAGAEQPCRASGPPKGVAVRSLVTTAKGVFRTVGGAATATPAKGTSTFITTDRCDGTVTEVGRGRVAVIAKRTGKRTVVRSGRAYIVRARLFAARKGRPR